MFLFTRILMPIILLIFSDDWKISSEDEECVLLLACDCYNVLIRSIRKTLVTLGVIEGLSDDRVGRLPAIFLYFVLISCISESVDYQSGRLLSSVGYVFREPT